MNRFPFVFKKQQIIDYLPELNAKGHHIIIDYQGYSSVEDLRFIHKKITYAELSVFIDAQYPLSDEIIEYCNANRIIVYFTIKNDLKPFTICHAGLCDMVLIVEKSTFNRLTDETISNIISKEVNVCIIDDIDYNNNDSNPIERLIANGFTRLYSRIQKHDYDNYCAEMMGLINRKMIAEFNTTQNIDIKRQVESLRKNALRRYNRSFKADNKFYDIVFVNIITEMVNNGERKNLGIEILVSILSSNGYNACTLYSLQKNFINDIISLIEEAHPKVIGFSCMQDNVRSITNSIKFLSKKYPTMTFFVGGAHAISLNEEFLRSSGANYVMIGESELNIVPLMNYIMHGIGDISQIKNLRYIDTNNNYIETPIAEPIKELDKIPFPHYIYKNNDELSLAGVITGRGCPYKCAFCFEGTRAKNVRYRSLDNVFEEISILLKNNKNIRSIQFYDDTFTLNPSRTIEFCERFKPLYKEFGITWICEIHCQTICNNPDLIKTMVDSGLVEAQIGLESTNDEILKKFNKSSTKEMILKTIENCQKAGLMLLEGNILLAATNETREQIESYFDSIEELLTIGKGMLDIFVVMFWPFPNTPITLNPSQYGISVLADQCEYSINSIKNFVSESGNISRSEYIELYDMLNNKIQSTYKKIVSSFTKQDAQKFWRSKSFAPISKWGKTLNSIEYMKTYFGAMEGKNSVAVDTDGAYLIRTFNMLEYKGMSLYLKETDLIINNLDSRILELCNGENTKERIAERLKISLNLTIERLKILEDSMLVFGSLI